MTNLQYAVLAAIVITVPLAIKMLRIHTYHKKQDFQRSLEMLLQPKETIQVICPQKDSRWILSNKRLICEKKGSFQAFSIKSIQKIQGVTKEGKNTVVPSRMDHVILKMEKDYILSNTGAEFADLVSRLRSIQKKKKAKAK